MLSIENYRANHEKYLHKTVNGIITSVSITESGLFYFFDSKFSKKILVTKLSQYEPYKRKPQAGCLFLYKYEQYYCRAFAIENNINSFGVHCFLIDFGKEILDLYEGKCFHIPKDFDYVNPSALLARIDKFPGRFKTYEKFLSQAKFKEYKIVVKQIIFEKDIFGENSPSLLVDIEALNNFNYEPAKVLKTDPLLMNSLDIGSPSQKTKYLLDRNGNYMPIMASEIKAATDHIKTKSKILVYPGMIARANLLYGCVKPVDKYYEHYENLVHLMAFINASDLKHESLDRIPTINEMVIAPRERDDGQQPIYYRGLVNEIFDEICLVILVDYGKTLPINYRKLSKFPSELRKLPLEGSRIHLTNVKLFDNDPEVNQTNMRIIMDKITPFGYGIIEEKAGYDISVKLFSKNATNIAKILEDDIPKFERQQAKLPN